MPCGAAVAAMATRSAAMPYAFISCRRSDSAQAARALHVQLRLRFGAGQVFMDVSAIQAGDVWPERLQRAAGPGQRGASLRRAGKGGAGRPSSSSRLSAVLQESSNRPDADGVVWSGLEQDLARRGRDAKSNIRSEEVTGRHPGSRRDGSQPGASD